jgi:hypothetical protein
MRPSTQLGSPMLYKLKKKTIGMWHMWVEYTDINAALPKDVSLLPYV